MDESEEKQLAAREHTAEVLGQSASNLFDLSAALERCKCLFDIRVEYPSESEHRQIESDILKVIGYFESVWNSLFSAGLSRRYCTRHSTFPGRGIKIRIRE